MAGGGVGEPPQITHRSGAVCKAIISGQSPRACSHATYKESRSVTPWRVGEKAAAAANPQSQQHHFWRRATRARGRSKLINRTKTGVDAVDGLELEACKAFPASFPQVRGAFRGEARLLALLPWRTQDTGVVNKRSQAFLAS